MQVLYRQRRHSRQRSVRHRRRACTLRWDALCCPRTALAAIWYGLTVPGLAMRVFSVGGCRQCAFLWMARVTCAEGSTSITPHGPLCGCIPHAAILGLCDLRRTCSVLHVHAVTLPVSFSAGMHGSRSVPRRRCKSERQCRCNKCQGNMPRYHPREITR